MLFPFLMEANPLALGFTATLRAWASQTHPPAPRPTTPTLPLLLTNHTNPLPYLTPNSGPLPYLCCGALPGCSPYPVAILSPESAVSTIACFSINATQCFADDRTASAAGPNDRVRLRFVSAIRAYLLLALLSAHKLFAFIAVNFCQ